MSSDVKTHVKDWLRKSIAVGVFNAIHVQKMNCTTQTEFSDIVKGVTSNITQVEFDDGIIPMTYSDFEAESLSSGDITKEQLDAIKKGTHRLVLVGGDTDARSPATIETEVI